MFSSQKQTQQMYFFVYNPKRNVYICMTVYGHITNIVGFFGDFKPRLYTNVKLEYCMSFLFV